MSCGYNYHFTPQIMQRNLLCEVTERNQNNVRWEGFFSFIVLIDDLHGAFSNKIFTVVVGVWAFVGSLAQPQPQTYRLAVPVPSLKI